MKKALLTLTIILFSFVIAACDLLSTTGAPIQITFETNGGTEIGSISVDSSFVLSDLDNCVTTKDGYTFDGWYTDDALETEFTGDVSKSLTLYAKWLGLYTVTWVNDNGITLETNEVLEGETPSYDGDIPTKAYDGTYRYTFDDWDPVVTSVTGDITYTATYTSTYDVTSFDETELNTTFGFDIYSYIPVIKTHDYIYEDQSSDTQYIGTITINDWAYADKEDYVSEIGDISLSSNDFGGWLVGSYEVTVNADLINHTYEIKIVGNKTETIADWTDLTSVIDDYYGITGVSKVLTAMSDFTHIGYVASGVDMTFIGFSDTYTSDSAINAYYNELALNDWGMSVDATSSHGYIVYVYDYISDTKGLAIYVEPGTNYAIVHIYTYDLNPIDTSLSTFVNEKSITTMEETEFGKSGLPSVGTYHVLVIPVEIKGTNFPSNYKSELELTFNGTSSETGWESVSSCYTKSSFGQLNLTFDIQDKFTTSQTRSYYENFGTDGDQYAIVEAVNGLDSSIDYSQYDVNNDGVIDSIIFVYSVAYDYDTDPWWAWVYDASYGQADSINNVDGKSMEYYMWASYDFSQDKINGLSGLSVDAETYIHELGHLLGYIDLYSTTHTYGPLGGWDMMAYNTGDHGPANKLLFGWLEPLVASSGTYDVTIDSYATDTDGKNSVVLIPYNVSDLDDGDAFDEYLLIMFYTPEGLYEGHLGTSLGLEEPGIVVYHVDARNYSHMTFWGYYFNYNNDGTSDFFVDLLEADKNNSIPSNMSHMMMSDLLTSGTLDLSTTYYWHQGGKIDVQIELLSQITTTSPNASLRITVN